MTNTLISHGAFVESGTTIENSIVGIRCHVGQGVTIRNSILMGADYYEDVDTRPNGVPRVGIGEGTIIEGAIIDKDCRIGRNVRIRPRPDLNPNCDVKGVYVRDGIIVVPKGATVPDGWEL
jgi:glucose-1-phosphate adenylyltransferase